MLRIILIVRANPGGYISPNEVVGRDGLIDCIWRRLEGQSVVLTSERRVGKTCVIRKMSQESGPSDFCIFRDIEGLHSPGELIETLYTDLQPVLSTGQKARERFRRAVEAVGGMQFKDVKLPSLHKHWKELLPALVADAVDEHSGRLIFFWDEMPLFVHNVSKFCGDQEAMMLLDGMRSLRQTFPTVRMVFTGSVGMHQVLKKLRKGGYANAPLNDMAVLDVPPLAPDASLALAKALIEGEQITVADSVSDVGAAVSESASRIPFYIHSIVTRIRDQAQPITCAHVKSQARSLVTDPNDPADFGYYEKRISTYYDPEDVPIALAVLDNVAAAPATFNDIYNLAKHSCAALEKEKIRQILALLSQDHYLERLDGSFQFRYSIVRDWWHYARS